MRTIRKTEEKEKYLLEAFKDLIEEKQLKWVKTEIEEQLKSFIKYLHIQKKLSPNQRIFENPESRIKGYDSFSEKIYRKGYVQSWTVTDDKDRNKELITRELPDLIGFRITCFFLDAELNIYELLKNYYNSGKFDKITLDFSENCRQKNGHTIYKVTGKYDNKFCFELQIKSIMHNIWGEVDHKTIYKSRDFDPNIETKRSISEELFNILKASDKQLQILFEETNTEEKLLQSLFFVKSKKKIAEQIKTDILAEHYDRFFNIFSKQIDRDRIKNYVIVALQDKKYVRKKDDPQSAETFEKELIKEIQNNFYEYDLKVIYYIASVIYPFSGYQEFLYYLANRLISQYSPETDEFGTDDDEFDDSTENDDEFDDSTENKDSQASTIKAIIMLLSQKIGRIRE